MIVTRFAPSPTGRLHLGHAYSAVLGHERARQARGKFLLRIDDLDQTRSRQAFVEDMIDDLRWLGLDWDDQPLVQSMRAGMYEAALERLRGSGLVYPCFCTRSDIAAALEAPHGPPPGSPGHYPGTCRDLADDPRRRATSPHSWRLNAQKALAFTGLPSWTEMDGRRFESSPECFDDVILARKDAPASYHLACVVDDFQSGVSLVTRGADLRWPTPIQRLLQMLLDFAEPAYFHHPLVAHSDGKRLAKREFAPTLAAMREQGIGGRALAAELLAGRLPLGFGFIDA